MYILFTKPNCPKCEMAKSLLHRKNLGYIVKQLDRDFTFEEFQKWYPEVKSFPLIFREHEKIGGWDDLRQKLS
jgi:glutaredoxin